MFVFDVCFFIPKTVLILIMLQVRGICCFERHDHYKSRVTCHISIIALSQCLLCYPLLESIINILYKATCIVRSTCYHVIINNAYHNLLIARFNNRCQRRQPGHALLRAAVPFCDSRVAAS